MRKFLLFGTMLGVASAAFAFGGVFSHGSKSSTYKGGVDAIGVHFGGDKKSSSIGINCPEHSSTQGDSPECVCDEGYEMTDSACKPLWPSTCAANDLYWCVETQTCVADKPACMAFCPEDRLCANGTTCCGQGNVCVDGNKCCFKNYEEDEGMCCDAPSSGFSTDSWDCCNEENTPYVTYADSENYVETACCSNTNTVIDIENGSALCCEAGATKYVSYYYGYNGEAIDVSYGCCNGTPYRSYEEEDGPRLWYEQSCCPIGTSPITKSIGYGETTILCCSSEEKLYCEEYSLYTTDDGEKYCTRWKCCEKGDVLEENGWPITCRPTCESGQVAGRITSGLKRYFAPSPWQCCEEGDTHYCNNWQGDDIPRFCETTLCCPKNKVLTSDGQYASACCESNETPYCSRKVHFTEEGEIDDIFCLEMGCCSTGPTVFDDVSVCCKDGETPFCARHDWHTGRCNVAECCAGVISEGSDWSTCCKEGETPHLVGTQGHCW